jgi:hypothetical protein
MSVFLLALTCFWLLLLATLWLAQGGLLRATWREAYADEALLLIESDDWGPGDDGHAERLRALYALLTRHRDSTGRPVVLTADMVLAVPDACAFDSNGSDYYTRRYLDEGWPRLHQTFRDGMQAGVLVPQLHGLEHCHGEAVMQTACADAALRERIRQPGWSDWEALPSPLQGHYVDGGKLPTQDLPADAQRERVRLAVVTFQRLFAMPTLSTVAPCYLWNDTTEQVWQEAGIRYIQTAGYRCTGRDRDGRYQQDPAILRAGQRNQYGQVYLVRNCMYEPADGRDASGCLRQLRQALRERTPIVISTHRYNYTRDNALFERSLAGLDRILTEFAHINPGRRHLSSPELGAWYADESLLNTLDGTPLIPIAQARGLRKLSAFLYRLWYRHAKLRLLAVASGLILPAGLVIAAARLTRPAST